MTNSKDLDPWLGGENPAQEQIVNPTSTDSPSTEVEIKPEESSQDPAVRSSDPEPGSEAVFIPSEPKIIRSAATEEPGEADSLDTWRLFVAIELPMKLKRTFADLAGSFRPREYERVRWIEQEAMHLTLKFLGDTPIEDVEAIKTSLARVASSSGKFTIKIGRTGCFPSFRDPRICWVGLAGELRRLEQLQGRVEGSMVNLGFKPEDREFRPHVTIGRTKAGVRGRLAEDVGISWRHAPLKITGQQLPVAAIALYRSYIDDEEEARYEQLANFELG
ncbi:MAG: RNA 2',3'-cyclic phosphodiesterase [Dehalococcoidia bacterium]